MIFALSRRALPAALIAILFWADGTTAHVRLWDNATLVGASFPAASATCNVVTSGGGVAAFDAVTLWYQNLAFGFVAPEGEKSVEFQFYSAGNGNEHSIEVNGRAYSHIEALPTGESSDDQAAALIGDELGLLQEEVGDPWEAAAAGAGTVPGPAVKDDDIPANFPKGHRRIKPYLRYTPQPNK